MATEGQHAYPKTAQSAINRHKERGEIPLATPGLVTVCCDVTFTDTPLGDYDVEIIHSLINSTPVAHVSFVPDPSNPLPVVLPVSSSFASERFR